MNKEVAEQTQDEEVDEEEEGGRGVDERRGKTCWREFTPQIHVWVEGTSVGTCTGRRLSGFNVGIPFQVDLNPFLVDLRIFLPAFLFLFALSILRREREKEKKKKKNEQERNEERTN